MNTKQILAVGISAALILAALGFYKFAANAGSATVAVAKTPLALAQIATSYFKSTFSNQVSVKLQSDVLTVKPIGELALAKVGVRVIDDYRNTYMGSEKVLIADEAYEAKIGWDLTSDITISVSPASQTVTIRGSKPRVLSCVHADPTPTILYRADGVINKLTPEDMVAVQQDLDYSARSSREVKEGTETAINGFKAYFSALFQLEGYSVRFIFDQSPAPSSAPPTDSRDQPGSLGLH